MTHQEFYENYITVNGLKPPPLTDFDKRILAAYDELKEKGVEIHIVWGKRRNTLLMKIIREKFIQDNNNLTNGLHN